MSTTGLCGFPFKTGLCALAFSGVLGLLAAWRVMGTTSRLKGLLDSVFTIPMVLPPTVCGFLLLMLFGQSSAVGRWLIAYGIEIVFSWPAAVIAAVVVSFPLVYRTALGAFEALDARMLDAARTLGWSEWRIFRFIMLPLAWPSIAAGAVLAFARAMGEFGCTLFFAGNYAGVTQTIPIAIYFEWMGGNTDVALFWVAVVILFSLAVVVGINVYTARQQRYRRESVSGTGSVAHARGGLLRRGAVRKGSGASGPRDEIDAAGGRCDSHRPGQAARAAREQRPASAEGVSGPCHSTWIFASATTISNWTCSSRRVPSAWRCWAPQGAARASRCAASRAWRPPMRGVSWWTASRFSTRAWA